MSTPQELARGLEDYKKELDGYIGQAEAHLDVPHGTIAAVETDPDHIAVLKIHATIEPLISEMLSVHIMRAVEHPKVAFEGAEALDKTVRNLNYDSKRKLAVAFGLMSKRQSEFVDAIAQIRNRYAHHLKNMALPVLAVADKIASEGGDKKLPVKLAGVISAEPLALSFGIRQFMYFQLANFLSDALHILRPPSPPSILGILSAMDTPDKAEFPGEVGDGPARAPRP
jgi:hypothetical protein